MPLVGFVAARFKGRGYDYEDLYQYGCIGLIKAVDRFDPNYGVTFSTYAVPLIIGEIKRFIRSDGSIHISRTIKEHAVTIEKLCEKTGIEKSNIIVSMFALSPIRSLNEPIASHDGEITLQDTIGVDERERINNNIALHQAIAKLTEQEQELIYRRYFKKHTQISIASDLGLTQVQVSRIERKVLLKLRSIL